MQPVRSLQQWEKASTNSGLRYVSKCLAQYKFKMEDLKTVARVYEKGDSIVTFDLESGYHHNLYCS